MPQESTPDVFSGDVPVASPTIADKLRAFAAGIIADPLNRKAWAEARPQILQSMASGRAAADKIANYLPVPQSILDHVSDVQDLAQDSAASVLSNDPLTTMKAQAASIGRGVRQGVTGFNEGLGSVLTTPADAVTSLADAVGNKVGGYFGSPPIALPKPSEMYDAAFVDPAGPATTRGQKLMRAGGNAVGQSVPTILGGLGAATSGVRSGATLAQQAAGGLVDSIEAPAATSTSLSDAFRKLIPQVPNFVRNATGKVIDAVDPANFQSKVQGVVNALNPTNVAAAFNPANLQGAADSTLDFVARNPMLAAKAKAVQAYHSGVKNERALLNQSPQPDASTPY